MELTGNDKVMSFDDLWAIVTEYVAHLRTHNQTARLEVLFDSLHHHKEYYGRGLKPMLDMMSKHGMPHQFPSDGSHLNEPASLRCVQNATSSFENNLLVASEYW